MGYGVGGRDSQRTRVYDLETHETLVWLAFGTAGDRSDEILHAFAYRAGRGVDHPIVAELHRYLRGRDPGDLVERLRAGAIDGGATDVPSEPDEVHALERMLRSSGPGDALKLGLLR